jgi:hypothetical protein
MKIKKSELIELIKEAIEEMDLEEAISSRAPNAPKSKRSFNRRKGSGLPNLSPEEWQNLMQKQASKTEASTAQTEPDEEDFDEENREKPDWVNEPSNAASQPIKKGPQTIEDWEQEMEDRIRAGMNTREWHKMFSRAKKKKKEKAAQKKNIDDMQGSMPNTLRNANNKKLVKYLEENKIVLNKMIIAETISYAKEKNNQ